MARKLTLILAILGSPLAALAAYKEPPPALSKLIDAPRLPNQLVSPQETYLLLMTRVANPSVEDLAQNEVRLGGMRINPKNFTPSRIRQSYKELSVLDIKSNKTLATIKAPQKSKIAYPKWSHDGKKLAYILVQDNKASLFIAEGPKFKTKLLKAKQLNALHGERSYHWSSDSKHLLYMARVRNKFNQEAGKLQPVIQESKNTKTAVRTYQDLLKTPSDEAYFTYLFESEIRQVNFKGRDQQLLKPDLYQSFYPAPQGEEILATILQEPFSYLVPYYRFPKVINVYRDGKVARNIARLKASDDIPQGFSATYEGPRSVQWIPKSNNWLLWVEARDQGDPKNNVKVRDQVMILRGLHQKPEAALDLKFRFSDVSWLDGMQAYVEDRWWSSRQEAAYLLNLKSLEKKTFWQRSYEDVYTDPGNPTKINLGSGESLVPVVDGKIFLSSIGYSSEGNLPFLQTLDLKSGELEKIWQTPAQTYSRVVAPLDQKGQRFLVRRETNLEPPNYFRMNRSKDKMLAMTEFPHPYPEFKDIERRELRYKRDDGLDLSATLYLPKGASSSQKLPILLWAYPREYKSKKAAGQIRTSPHQFNRVSYWGPLPFLSQGFAVMDRVAMPIVGEGGDEPNDTFVRQLVANAKAALDTAAESGVIDTSRAFIGGHSYGAFMTANLLAHSDLFVGGIARSGAYNRTFTPFGFQAEERTYWQAPDIYNTMSPFQNAHKINEPLLLIHGANDNNSGTFPMQSERLYHAISGLGGTVRLVMFPNESHGYRASESLKHMLWEELQWLRKYSQPKRAG